jgi:hypothetical protein
MIDRAEYKRRQAPPGVKLRPKAFGRDRRTPITNHYDAGGNLRFPPTRPRSEAGGRPPVSPLNPPSDT